MASRLTGTEFQIGTTQTISGVSTTVSNNDTEVPTSKAVKNYADSLKVPAGTVVWFSGNTGKVPSGYLVCNGQAVSRTTYAGLYAVIGTKYGTGNGSSTFNVPDLSDGNGRFIRAGFTDSVIGTKQSDQIRNIKGQLSGDFRSNTLVAHGCFYHTGPTGWGHPAAKDEGAILTLEANNPDPNYTNPIAGHAAGDDIHPYDIYLLPLIAY